MKKEILVAISVAGVLFGLSVSLAAQEKLSLAQCREMALKYNKDMAAANKQTEAARLMSLSYKANFFPNFTANGTGIYSTADGSLGVPGGNLPVFLPNPATGELVSSGFAYFPGLNLDYKVGTVTRAVYKWSNLFIWEEKSVPPIKCHYWEKKWHT